MNLLTAGQQDLLREFAHLGIAKAASGLSRLAGDVGVMVEPPTLLAGTRWQASWLLGGREVPIFLVTFDLTGDLPELTPGAAQLWWVLKRPDAQRLSSRLLRRPEVRGALTNDAGAALSEAANIVASACASALGTMVHANVLPSTPAFSETTVGSFAGERIDAPLHVVFASTFTSVRGPTFSGAMVLLFNESVCTALLRRLGS